MNDISTFTRKISIYLNILIILIQFSEVIVISSRHWKENESKFSAIVPMYIGNIISKTLLCCFILINGIKISIYFEKQNFENFYHIYFKFLTSKVKYFAKFYYPFIIHHLIYINYIVPKKLYHVELNNICPNSFPFKLLFLSNIFGDKVIVRLLISWLISC